MGLKFGLWVELEMVNKNSDCYRAHPDWLIGAPDRFESHSRHQHVLDFSRPEVVDFIYDSISKVIEESSISYIKWDMNRYMSSLSAAAHLQQIRARLCINISLVYMSCIQD